MKLLLNDKEIARFLIELVVGSELVWISESSWGTSFSGISESTVSWIGCRCLHSQELRHGIPCQRFMFRCLHEQNPLNPLRASVSEQIRGRWLCYISRPLASVPISGFSGETAFVDIANSGILEGVRFAPESSSRRFKNLLPTGLKARFLR